MKTLKVSVERAGEIYTAHVREFPQVVIQTRNFDEIEPRISRAWESYKSLLSECDLQFQFHQKFLN
jgi:predicted RNase H-like HicB family nuclease